MGVSRGAVQAIERRIAEELGVRDGQVTAAVGLLDGGSTVPFVARYRKEVTGGLDDAQLRTLEERLGYLRELEERRAAVLASDRGAGQARRRAPRADPRRRDQGAARGHLPAVQAEAPHQGADRPRGRPRAARRPADRPPDTDPPLPRRRSSTPTGRSPTPPPPSTAPAPSSSSASPRTPTSSATSASASGSRAGSARASATARRRRARSSPTTSTSPSPSPSCRPTASSRCSAARRRTSSPSRSTPTTRPPSSSPARRHTSAPSRAASASRTTGARPTSGWPTPCAGPGARRSSSTSASTLRMQLRQAGRGGGRTRVRRQPARPAARCPGRRARHDGPRPGLPHRRQGRRRRRDRQASSRPTSSTRTSRSTSGTASLATLARAGQGARRRASSPSATARPRARPTGSPPTSSRRHPELKLTTAVVSEAGASVYSASAFASQELPGMDVSLRGAVSIARRLQDPLAELVKIDPKSIGVGQYQHDIAQNALSRSLDAVVEDCVNAVGVDVNTASAPLLTCVSGITPRPGREHRRPPRRERPLPHRARRSRTCRASAPRRSSRRPASSASRAATTRSTRPPCTPRPTPSCAGCSSRPGSSSTSLIGNTAALQAIRPADYVDDTFGLPTVTDILSRARQARPRPAADVQDGHLQGGRRGDQATSSRA